MDKCTACSTVDKRKADSTGNKCICDDGYTDSGITVCAACDYSCPTCNGENKVNCLTCSGLS